MRSDQSGHRWIGWIAGGTLFSIAAMLHAADYETAGKVPSDRYLAADEMAGEEWTVAAEADNDGAMNHYVVTSRFGDFEAVGRAKVVIRGKEVDALVELEKVSKSQVFADAVKESALGSVETVKAFAKAPVATVKAVPSAVGGWFKKTKFQLEETYDDAKESKEERDQEKAEREALAASGDAEDVEQAKKDDQEGLQEKGKEAATTYALKYLKISGAERRWYAELGIDPYTDNEPLRAVIKSYSRVDGLTRFGMKFAGIPKIPGERELRKTMDLVWETDPWELRKMNRDMLIAAGISEEIARDFEDNPNLSLTLQTGFIQALTALEGVEGRQHLLARALDLESKGDGQTLAQSTALLLLHHKGTIPLAEILPGSRLPVARATDGRLVVALAADAVFWTDRIAEGARGFSEIYREDSAKIRQIWVVGQVSNRFKTEMKDLGWEIIDQWKVALAKKTEASAG